MLNAKNINTLMSETLKRHRYANNTKNVSGIFMISKTGSLLMSKFTKTNSDNRSVLNFISLLIASNYSQEDIVVEKLSDGNLIGLQSYEINLNLTNNQAMNGLEEDAEDGSNQQLYNMSCCNIPQSDLIIVYLSEIEHLELGALKLIVSKDVQLYSDLYGYRV